MKNKTPYFIPKQSNGEKKVEAYLKRKKIKFEMEKTFDWLKNKKGNNLRFDFYLPDYNIAIEFDGVFHYSSARQKSNDRQKNMCCLKNNVNLLRIPYWEMNNVGKIINQYIKNVTR
jgi:very-short-patch-repair endonuclease